MTACTMTEAVRAAPGAAESPRFDAHGRCIPTAASAAVHAVSRRYFVCQPPDVVPAASHARLARHLGLGLTAGEFAERAAAIRARLEADPGTRDILRGVAVPFVLPRGAAGDLGTLLEERFLPAVSAAYHEKFPDYRFTNHHKTGLAGKLAVRPGSRHERLVDALTEREVVGIYFPCLSEYSIPAAVEQLAALPEHFLLAGGFDTAAALVAAPELLLRRDGYPPLLWLAALAAEKPGIAYHFEAYGYNLSFNRRPHLEQAAEYWWCGLTVIDAP
jgi:hypothetical protein